ncbi:MAG: zinc ribbon domain-containing protein [Oscillospiraceae bacterium]|nr:zinc ribbon domain-containing protein [Oscillospiraceae bacterium]
MNNYYHNHSTAPLLFHRIYWLMWTPAQITMGIIAASDYIRSNLITDFWTTLDFGYGIATCLLMAIYFIGFFKWKLYGWYALMTQLVINVCYAVLSLFVNWSDDSSFAISLLIGTLIRCVPVGIYYLKRRPLFSRKGFDIPAAGMLFGNPYQHQNPQNQWHNRQQNSNDQWQNEQWNTPVNQHQNSQNPPQQPQSSNVQINPNFTEEGERIYFCPECGNSVKQSSNFCLHCGAKLK